MNSTPIVPEELEPDAAATFDAEEAKRAETDTAEAAVEEEDAAAALGILDRGATGRSKHGQR